MRFIAYFFTLLMVLNVAAPYISQIHTEKSLETLKIEYEGTSESGSEKGETENEKEKEKEFSTLRFFGRRFYQFTLNNGGCKPKPNDKNAISEIFSLLPEIPPEV